MTTPSVQRQQQLHRCFSSVCLSLVSPVGVANVVTHIFSPPLARCPRFCVCGVCGFRIHTVQLLHCCCCVVTGVKCRVSPFKVCRRRRCCRCYCCAVVLFCAPNNFNSARFVFGIPSNQQQQQQQSVIGSHRRRRKHQHCCRRRQHKAAAAVVPSFVGSRRVCPCPRPFRVSAVGLLVSTQRRRRSAAHHNRGESPSHPPP